MSPIALAKESIGVSIATESQAARLFTNGMQSSGVLEFDHQLSPEQIENLRTQFAANYSGHKNAHKPMILESGMKFASVGMSADDSQFLESRKFQISEIARWYRVPLHMLAEMDRSTFSNIEHQSIEFAMYAIRPWLVRIEQSIARDLLTDEERRTMFASHTVEGLLRGDTASRYEAYGKGIQDGWLSRNEVRRLENMNPVDGLDEYILPLNFTTISEREKELTSQNADAMAKREFAALKVEAGRLEPLAFAEWLPEFYDRHAQAVADALAIPLWKAQVYTDKRINEIMNLANPAEAVPVDRAELTKQIEALA